VQNAVHDVGDLMSLETSFTDTSASLAESASLSRPATMLTFESECPAAVSTGRHRQSVDSSVGAVSHRLLVGKSAEFPAGKPVEILPARRASSPAGPTAQHRLVNC